MTLPTLLGECLAFDMKAARLSSLRSRLFEAGRLTGVTKLAAEENNVARLAERLLEWGLVPPDVPGRSSAQQTLRRQLAVHAERREVMAHHLREMVAELNQQGIRPVLLKGARSLWEKQPSWRYLRDVDLLIRDENAASAQEALQRLGYGPDPDLAKRPDRHHLEPLYKKGFPGWVEIHRRGGNRYAERLMPTSELFATSSFVEQDALFVGLLDPVTHLLHGVIHHHVGHSADARGTLSLKGLYEFAWAVNALRVEGRRQLLDRCQAHPRLAAILDYWLAAASLLFHLTIEPPFALSNDALERAKKTFGGDQTLLWKYPGYGDEIRMAWAKDRLLRSPTGQSAIRRQLLRLKVIASLLPSVRRKVER